MAISNEEAQQDAEIKKGLNRSIAKFWAKSPEWRDRNRTLIASLKDSLKIYNSSLEFPTKNDREKAKQLIQLMNQK